MFISTKTHNILQGVILTDFNNSVRVAQSGGYIQPSILKNCGRIPCYVMSKSNQTRSQNQLTYLSSCVMPTYRRKYRRWQDDRRSVHLNREAINQNRRDQETDTDAFCNQVLLRRWDIVGHDCGVSNMLQDYKTSEQKLRLQKTGSTLRRTHFLGFFAPIAHQKTLSRKENE